MHVNAWAFVEVGKALMHGVAEIKQDERALELLLHCFPLLFLPKCNLAAWLAHDLINAALDNPNPLQALTHRLNDRRW
uniref:Uncharacterized protein n=1 Tax=Oryza brachyantha TaxID=4533 RepID=J3MV46_ORYBR